ncbi:MAG: Nif3-like dinuclear metal center hexameric protein, partial [Oscillospiraceae bacterium]|nr:Nif3-like dinuclear metal center hexameric protein [Oscillospiraceae bacterium]
MSKNPLMRDSQSFEPVKLNLTEALSNVKRTNLQAYNRLVQLSKVLNIMTKNNVVMYEIAYSLQQISKNKDSILYGYTTVAEMVETMYGYKKSTTSKMLAVAKNFLIMDADGKVKSVFKSGDNDIPMSSLYELLQDKQTMSLRKNELIEFYKNFPLHEMKQTEFRELKRIAYHILVSGKPLLYSTYNELIMAENQSVKNQEAEQDDDQGNIDTNAIMQDSFPQTALNATGDESVINIRNQDIYNWLDQIAPFENQETWDNSGLLIGSPEDSVSGILVTLDITRRAIEKAYQ